MIRLQTIIFKKVGAVESEEGAEIGFTSKRLPISYPQKIAENDTEALEVFLRETLPELRVHFEIEVRTADWPELIELSPVIAFKVHALKDGNVSMTGTVEYPALAHRQIAKRNFDLERSLHRQLKNEYQMNLNQPVTLTPEAAFLLRARTQTRALDGYLSTSMQNLAGLSLDQALAKPDQILHLLRLKEQNAEAKGAVATLAETLRASFTAPSALEINTAPLTSLPPQLWSSFAIIKTRRKLVTQTRRRKKVARF